MFTGAHASARGARPASAESRALHWIWALRLPWAAAWPVHTSGLLPLGGEDEVIATSLYLSRRFGDTPRLMLVKINAIGLLASHPFFGGWGTERFRSLAFVAPPSGVVPPVIIGGVLTHAFEPLVADCDGVRPERPDDQLLLQPPVRRRRQTLAWPGRASPRAMRSCPGGRSTASASAISVWLGGVRMRVEF